MTSADDVTAWRQSGPSIFMFKWNRHIFRDTGRILENLNFLSNHHQTWSTYVVYHNTEPYSFSRSKVK